jgi:hypothetical protein
MMMFAVTTMEKLQKVPLHFWLKALAAIAIFVLGVMLLRKIAGMNKAILGGILFIALTMLGFTWVYERNEPEWARPLVERLAGFLPSKGTAQKHVESRR